MTAPSNGRSHGHNSGRSLLGSRLPQADEDLSQLRQLVLERHDIRIPADDPACIEFTVFAQVVDRAVSALREEHKECAQELRLLVDSAHHALRDAMEDASKPLARAMADTFNPRAVANRITGEVCEDLQREGRAAVREAYRIGALAVVVTLTCCCALLYVASERLAEAQLLFRAHHYAVQTAPDTQQGP